MADESKLSLKSIPEWYLPTYLSLLGQQAPYAWTAPSASTLQDILSNPSQWAVGDVTETGLSTAMSQEQMGQAYYDFLLSYLKAQQYLGELDEDEATALLNYVANALDAGVSPATMPYFSEFYSNYQLMYPTSTTSGYTDEELSLISAQADYYQAQILQILNDIQQTGTMTAYEEAYLEYLTAQLEETARQFNLGNQLDWANYDLSKQQLELSRNEWLAELQASPANWMERWYAERLPWSGTTKLPLASDQVIAQYTSPTTTNTWSTLGSASATASLPTTSSWAMPSMAERTARLQMLKSK